MQKILNIYWILCFDFQTPTFESSRGVWRWGGAGGQASLSLSLLAAPNFPPSSVLLLHS